MNPSNRIFNYLMKLWAVGVLACAVTSVVLAVRQEEPVTFASVLFICLFGSFSFGGYLSLILLMRLKPHWFDGGDE